MTERRERIQIMDAARGTAVVLMVIHHFLYDAVVFLGAPEWLFTNPVFDVLHFLFAGLFIFLSGVSSRFSRSNTVRGLKALAAAMCITAVTAVMEMTVLFGVLHLLAFCMIFYGLTHAFWERLPGALLPALCAALTVLTAPLADGEPSSLTFLWMFGWTYPGFSSSDYFPIFPWIFVFLAGAWAGGPIRDRRLPDWFYAFRAPLPAAIGRKALWIYLLHQPVLYALTLGIKAVFPNR